MDDDIDFKELLKIERNKDKEIIPLSDDFYDRIAEHIARLENEKKNIKDIYSTKYTILENEIRTTRKLIKSIIYKRTTKIIKEARYNSEICSEFSKTEVDEKYNELMTPEELEFYENLIKLMIEYRKSIFNKIFNEKSERLKKDEKKSEISFYKRDINKEYMLVHLLKDISTFIAVDERTHTLSKEDIAVISTINAKALIARNVARKIVVNR